MARALAAQATWYAHAQGHHPGLGPIASPRVARCVLRAVCCEGRRGAAAAPGSPQERRSAVRLVPPNPATPPVAPLPVCMLRPRVKRVPALVQAVTRGLSSMTSPSGFYSEIQAPTGVYKWHVDGEWRESASGKTVGVVNPCTRATAYQVPGEWFGGCRPR